MFSRHAKVIIRKAIGFVKDFLEMVECQVVFANMSWGIIVAGYSSGHGVCWGRWHRHGLSGAVGVVGRVWVVCGDVAVYYGECLGALSSAKGCRGVYFCFGYGDIGCCEGFGIVVVGRLVPVGLYGLVEGVAGEGPFPAVVA